jgi:hypothetical protein
MPTKQLHKTNKTGIARENHFISKAPEFAISGFRGYIRGARTASYMETFKIPYGTDMRNALVEWMNRETRALIGNLAPPQAPGEPAPGGTQNTAAYLMVKQILPVPATMSDADAEAKWMPAVGRLFVLCHANVTDVVSSMTDVAQCQAIGITNSLNDCGDYKRAANPKLFPDLPDPPWNDGKKWCTHCWLCGLPLPDPITRKYDKDPGIGDQPDFCQKINQTTGALEEMRCPSRECEHILPFLVGAVLLQLVTAPGEQFTPQRLVEYGWGHKPCNGFKNQGMFIKHTFTPNDQGWMNFKFEPDLIQIRNYVEVLFSVVQDKTTSQFTKIADNEYYNSAASDTFNYTVFNPVGLRKTLNPGPNSIGTIKRREKQARYSYNTIRAVMSRICEALNGSETWSTTGVDKAAHYPVLLCYSQILRYLSDNYIEGALMSCKELYTTNGSKNGEAYIKFKNHLDNSRPFSSVSVTPPFAGSADVASAILSHKSPYLLSFVNEFTHALSKIKAIPNIPQSNNTFEKLANGIISIVHKKATTMLQAGAQMMAGGAQATTVFGKKRNKFGGPRTTALNEEQRTSIKNKDRLTTDARRAARWEEAMAKQKDNRTTKTRKFAVVRINEAIITESHNTDQHYTTLGFSQLFMNKLRGDIGSLLENINTIYHGNTVYDIIDRYKTDLLSPLNCEIDILDPGFVENDYSDVAYETFLFLRKLNPLHCDDVIKDIYLLFGDSIKRNPPPSHPGAVNDPRAFINERRLWLYSYLLTRLLVEHLESIYIKLPEYGNDLNYIRLCIEDKIDLIRTPPPAAAFGKKQNYKKSNKLKLMSTTELKTKLKSVGIRVTKDIKGKRKELTRKELESKASFFKKLQLKAKTVGVKLMYKNKKRQSVYKAKTRLENEIKRQLERIKKMKKANKPRANKPKANKNKFG